MGKKGTMERIGALCWKHHVVVISDEIHCELTDPGKEYFPCLGIGGVQKEQYHLHCPDQGVQPGGDPDGGRHGA